MVVTSQELFKGWGSYVFILLPLCRKHRLFLAVLFAELSHLTCREVVPCRASLCDAHGRAGSGGCGHGSMMRCWVAAWWRDRACF